MHIIRKHLSEIHESERSQIDGFIELNGGLVFHETSFNEIASGVFKTNCHYFIAYSNNDIAGICPVHVIRKGTLKLLYSNLSSYEIPYGGWVFDENKTSISSLLERTKLHFNESLIYSSNIQPINNVYKDLGFSNLKRLNTVILDLGESTDEIFSLSFKHQQRKKIRKAEKLGVTVVEISSENFQEFFLLSVELKERVGLPVRLPDFYAQVLDFYSRNGRAVCLAAKYNEQYISAMILLANKNYTIAWVAGRKNEIPNNLYQNELLIWESIIWAKKFGSHYFDLCGLDEVKLPHLARIKLSFSKEIVPFYYLSKKTTAYRVLNKIQNVFCS
jgi:hypothetical protein